MSRSAAPKKNTKIAHPKAPFTFRRNVLPPLMGVLAAAGVMGLLNSQWIEAQYRFRFTPHTSASALPVENLHLDPSAQPRIYVPSVGIDAPFVTTETSYDDKKVQLALRDGIVHYGTTALPGQLGNVVALGHSSGALWEPGDYKFAFTMLEKVPNKALVYIDYKGTRYIYRVTSRQVISPNNMSVVQSTTKPELTMITCTPVGVSSHRLVLHAEQISPKPAAATTTQAQKPITAYSLPK